MPPINYPKTKGFPSFCDEQGERPIQIKNWQIHTKSKIAVVHFAQNVNFARQMAEMQVTCL